jgi:hypothetical protein
MTDADTLTPTRGLSAMPCLKCGHEKVYVVDVRSHKRDRARRRRYECLRCSHRYTTYELPAEAYETLLGTRIAQFEAVIASLRAIKAQLVENCKV